MSMTFNSRFDVGEVSDFYAGDVSPAGGNVSQAFRHSLPPQLGQPTQRIRIARLGPPAAAP
jgi:hypothetical protein